MDERTLIEISSVFWAEAAVVECEEGVWWVRVRGVWWRRKVMGRKPGSVTKELHLPERGRKTKKDGRLLCSPGVYKLTGMGWVNIHRLEKHYAAYML